MRILVFEGRNEIIIGDPEQVEALVITWFRDTGRSLEDYETYTVDGTEGFNFTTDIHTSSSYEYAEVREMIPASLREELNTLGALNDTEEDLAAYKEQVAA